MVDLATIRLPEPRDRFTLAAVHAEAWRYAYWGIIPGITLERMIARRGPASWGSGRGARYRTLLIEFGGNVVGYTLFGACRMGGIPRMGEISELYVKPEYHGAGFGRSLFEEARRRLDSRNFKGLIVWALAENVIACAFYSAMGGDARFRVVDTLGGVRLQKIGFHWA